MAVFLTILKILGITVLVILGVVLLLLLLILFMPMHYSFDAVCDRENKPLVHAKVNWLFWIIRFRFTLKGKDMDYYVKALWIQLFPEKETEDDLSDPTGLSAYLDDNELDEALKNEPAGGGSVDKALPSDGADPEDSAAKMTVEDNSDNITADTIAEDIKGKPEEEKTPGEDKKPKKKRQSVFSKIKKSVNKFKYKFRQICDRIRNGRLKIEETIDKLTDERTMQAVTDLLLIIKKLCRHIRPRKGALYAHYGFEDPSLTGEVYGIYNALYPVHMGKPDVVPDFENKCFDLDAYLKGYVQLFFVIIALIRMYFNKDIKRLIGMIKNR